MFRKIAQCGTRNQYLPAKVSKKIILIVYTGPLDYLMTSYNAGFEREKHFRSPSHHTVRNFNTAWATKPFLFSNNRRTPKKIARKVAQIETLTFNKVFNPDADIMQVHKLKPTILQEIE